LGDEFDAVSAWVEFSEQAGTALVVCVSAAERRGVMGPDQALEHDKRAHNLHAAFRVEGLGALHDASLSADRTVTFK
jgi:tRNA 2-thiouridine synthesizing protein D